MADKNFRQADFPKTNEKLWNRVREAASAMSVGDPNRLTWLALVAAHFGETDQELEYIGESVNRSPLNKQLRMQYAERLVTAGRFDAAVENAEIGKSLAPDDPQIEASLQRIKRWHRKPKARNDEMSKKDSFYGYLIVLTVLE